MNDSEKAKEPAKVAAEDRGEGIGLMEPLLIQDSSSRRAGLTDLALELAAATAGLRRSLPPGVVRALADLVRAMNCYYSNLIEGHDTHPIDIERALADDYSTDPEKRDLQREARAHITVQAWIDDGGLDGRALKAAGLREIHERFCKLLPDALLWIENPTTGERVPVVPGELRTHDVKVGRLIAISPGAVPRFLDRFESAFAGLGRVDAIVAAATAHHRLLWIHPFVDGNGRVARLMSYAVLREPNFILRGISVGNEFNSNNASPIGFYVDENYISARFAQGMQLFDLERVEVVKGPQGTLYGRNTTGGAINVITRRPGLAEANADFSVGYASFNTTTAAASGEYTFIPDKFGVRAALSYAEGDGEIENHFANAPDARTTENISGRVALRYQDGGFDANLRLYSSSNTPISDAPVALGVGPGGSQPTGYVRPSSYSIWDTDAGQLGRYKSTGEGAALTLTWGVGDLKLVSLTAADSGSMRVHQDPDASPADWFQIDWNADYSQLNQDIRLQYKGERAFATVGAYYGRDENKTANRYSFFNALRAFFPGFNPPANPAASLAVGLFPGPVTGFQVDHKFTQTRTSYAVYAEGEYSVSDRLTLIAGLRYTNDEVELSDISSTALNYDGVPQLSLIPPGFLPAGAFGPIKNDGSTVTGRVIAKYALSPDANIFASYSRGYRAGAINGTAYLSPAQLTFVDPEEVNAYEVGLKSDWLGRTVTFNASAFFYDYSNQQIQEVILVTPFLRNAPSAEAYGLDLETSWRATDDLRLSAGLGLIHTEYTELTLSGVNLSGNRFTNAPNVTANLAVDWDVGSLAGGNVNFYSTATYTGDQFFSPFNGGPAFVGDTIGDKQLRQEGYWLANARLTWSKDNVSLSAWANNLFEEEYVSYGLNLRNGFGFDYLVAGKPRTVGAELQLNF